jgi:hypothetical protein
MPTNSNAEILGALDGPERLLLVLKIVVEPAALVLVQDKLSINPPSTVMFCPLRLKGLLMVYIPIAIRIWLLLGAVAKAVAISMGSFILPIPVGKPEGVT